MAFSIFDNHRRGTSFVYAPSSAGNEGEYSTAPQSPARNIEDGNNIRRKYSLRSLSKDIAKRFNGKNSKFDGSSDQSWQEHASQYMRAAKELELSNAHKRAVFHQLLTVHALAFYTDEIDGKCKTFQEIMAVMPSLFISDAKIEAIANRLRSIHISEFEMGDKSEKEALSDLVREIPILVPRAPKECRTGRYRKITLVDATRGRQWVLSITSSTYSRGFNYQQLLSDMQNSLQLHNAHKTFTENNEMNKDINTASVESKMRISQDREGTEIRVTFAKISKFGLKRISIIYVGIFWKKIFGLANVRNRKMNLEFEVIRCITLNSARESSSQETKEMLFLWLLILLIQNIRPAQLKMK